MSCILQTHLSDHDGGRVAGVSTFIWGIPFPSASSMNALLIIQESLDHTHMDSYNHNIVIQTTFAEWKTLSVSLMVCLVGEQRASFSSYQPLVSLSSICSLHRNTNGFRSGFFNVQYSCPTLGGIRALLLPALTFPNQP